MPTHTRVLVHDVPTLLGDIVRGAIAQEPQLELLAESPTGADHIQWCRPEPDVVVASTANIRLPLNVGMWLSRWPRARIVVIEVSGRQTVMYELRPRAIQLGALSPEQLVSVIRDPPLDD
jgi:hypothetical protein